MEEKISCKPVIVSDKFKASFDHIYLYSIETFGYFQAEHYDQMIEKAIKTLSDWHTVYPECRHIPTKTAYTAIAYSMRI